VIFGCVINVVATVVTLCKGSECACVSKQLTSNEKLAWALIISTTLPTHSNRFGLSQTGPELNWICCKAGVILVTFLAALGIKRFSGMKQLDVEFAHALKCK